MTTVATYEVDVEYVGRDRGAQGAADRLGLSIGQLQNGLGTVRGGLDTAVHGMERLALGAASLGVGAGAAGLRMLVGQMVELNSHTEDTRTALAGMLQANGATGNWAESMDFAQRAMGQIRRDAAALPGEAEDYITIFRSGLAPMLQSGLDTSGAVQFADRFGAVTSMLGVDAEQAGRDLNLMLQGHAGAQVRSWGALQAQVGKTAEEFNRLGISQRRVLLDQALGHYDDAIAEAGHSWGGMVGTLKTYRDDLIRLAGQPVFDRMKGEVQVFIAYLDTHRDQIEQTVSSWGQTAAHWLDVAFVRGREGLTWLRSNWRSVRDELTGDLQNVARLYVGLRAGSAGLGAVQGGLGLLGNLKGLVGGAGEAGAGAAGAIGVAELGAVAGGAALAIGAMAYAASSGAFDVRAALADLHEPALLLRTGFTHLWQASEPLVALYGSTTLGALTTFAQAVGYVVGPLADLASVTMRFYREVGGYLTDPLRAGLHALGIGRADPFSGVGAYNPATQDIPFGNDARHVVVSPTSRPDERRRPAAPAGHTTIHNHFKIEQSDNPERVAVTVQHVLERELRNPTQAARPGLTRLG